MRLSGRQWCIDPTRALSCPSGANHAKADPSREDQGGCRIRYKEARGKAQKYPRRSRGTPLLFTFRHALTGLAGAGLRPVGICSSMSHLALFDWPFSCIRSNLVCTSMRQRVPSKSTRASCSLQRCSTGAEAAGRRSYVIVVVRCESAFHTGIHTIDPPRWLVEHGRQKVLQGRGYREVRRCYLRARAALRSTPSSRDD